MTCGWILQVDSRQTFTLQKVPSNTHKHTYYLSVCVCVCEGKPPYKSSSWTISTWQTETQHRTQLSAAMNLQRLSSLLLCVGEFLHPVLHYLSPVSFRCAMVVENLEILVDFKMVI